MAVSVGERVRYAAYAIVVAAAALAYFWLNSDSGQDQGLRRLVHEDDLPELRLIESDMHQGTNRDLFVFAKNSDGATDAPVIAFAPEPAESVFRKPDLLNDVQVLGLVRRSDSSTVLLKLGTSLMDVPLGKPFGDGDLLTVISIEGPNVVIEDKSSKNSRTFTLSEE